ncbi:hypothetical protein AOQ84DRAFT_196097 [Glonium stellatum]|uniref:Uncharacterized protein n=1 Tax=Glonium stellatum TaxID=574774 RepID=A0A8E2JVZ8_9PEZI|nr:hypothetical protein AOQ84DRAFT_196097 [Glonium stellatum]
MKPSCGFLAAPLLYAIKDFRLSWGVRRNYSCRRMSAKVELLRLPNTEINPIAETQLSDESAGWLSRKLSAPKCWLILVQL